MYGLLAKIAEDSCLSNCIQTKIGVESWPGGLSSVSCARAPTGPWFSVLPRICVHRNRCSACWATIGIGAQPIAGEHSYRTISRTTVFGDQNLCPWESVLSLGCDHIGIGAQPRVRPWESVLSLLPDHTNQCVVRGRTH